MDPNKRPRAMMESEAECPCKQKNRITCITLRNVDGASPTGSVSRLIGGDVNAANSAYEFDVGTSFSVHRHKPCIVTVNTGSVGYLAGTNITPYGTTIPAAITIVTNIEAQGLAKNLIAPGARYKTTSSSGEQGMSPATQMVQCEMNVSHVSGTAHATRFHATEVQPVRFRCQSLPDRIQLQMERLSFNPADDELTQIRTAPNYISLTLEIEFDE